MNERALQTERSSGSEKLAFSRARQSGSGSRVGFNRELCFPLLFVALRCFSLLFLLPLPSFELCHCIAPPSLRLPPENEPETEAEPPGTQLGSTQIGFAESESKSRL